MNSGCIELIIDTITNSVDTIPKTKTEREKKKTLDPPKHLYRMRSDSNKNISYKITYCPNSNGYRCECKAWECCWYNINQQDNQKTCKHIIAIMSEKAEQDRITQNKGKWLYIPAKK